MRSVRYEALTWADVALEADGAEDHPLHATLLGMSATAAYSRGEFDRAMALARAVRAEEAARGLVHTGLAERVAANVANVRGDLAESIESTREMIAVAEESGRPSFLVHAHTVHAVASSYHDAEEATRSAKRARVAADATQCPSDRAAARTAEGFAALDRDEALRAFRESAGIATGVGNRWSATFAGTEACALLLDEAATVGEACRGVAASVDVWFRAGEWAQQWFTLARAAVALERTGQRDLACRVIGAVEVRASVRVEAPPLRRARALDALAELADRMRAELGEDRFGELAADGAALPVTEVVHRTRAALAGVDG
jgi:hypothetical protein